MCTLISGVHYFSSVSLFLGKKPRQVAIHSIHSIGSLFIFGNHVCAEFSVLKNGQTYLQNRTVKPRISQNQIFCFYSWCSCQAFESIVLPVVARACYAFVLCMCHCVLLIVYRNNARRKNKRDCLVCYRSYTDI